MHYQWSITEQSFFQTSWSSVYRAFQIRGSFFHTRILSRPNFHICLFDLIGCIKCKQSSQSYPFDFVTYVALHTVFKRLFSHFLWIIYLKIQFYNAQCLFLEIWKTYSAMIINWVLLYVFVKFIFVNLLKIKKYESPSNDRLSYIMPANDVKLRSLFIID